ncbi:hypothetical protein DPEC_G00348840 [Dallia pectoralis]|uniref:Uncharacterized protein n=1 Tax=Dallia pectoralis TaxID=75939 RepID=A0ACC2F197_DALPE|nr:hypothetical protein DPEC_G00348840 [Dallia pectoralis]
MLAQRGTVVEEEWNEQTTSCMSSGCRQVFQPDGQIHQLEKTDKIAFPRVRRRGRKPILDSMGLVSARRWEICFVCALCSVYWFGSFHGLENPIQNRTQAG